MLLLSLLAAALFGEKEDQDKVEQIGFKILNNASSDFDIVNTFLGVTEFKAPSFEFIRSLGNDIMELISGGLDIGKFITNNVGALRGLDIKFK